MISRRLITATGLLMVPAASFAAARKQPAPTLAARGIVDRYVEARGGMARIAQIRSLIVRGEGAEGDRPMRAGRVMTRARPYYLLVGDPAKKNEADFAEGNDGAHWEYYKNPGLVLRSTGAPADAIRHTAYFDDPLVTSAREPGWSVDLIGEASINGSAAHHLRVTYPDKFQADYFVDKTTYLVTADRKVAPVHAFGEAVRSETRWSGWRPVAGVLFASEGQEVEIATGRVLNRGRWTSYEPNVALPVDAFSPPPLPDTPLVRMLNAAYAARIVPTDALGWYTDFRADPANAGVDTQLGMASIGYQILKTGQIDTAILLLEANARDNPASAMALFGLGRAYRNAGRKQDAAALFQRALQADPAYTRAADALKEMSDTGR